MPSSVLPDLFEYLCYGSTTNINMWSLTVRGWTSESDVYRRWILTTEVVSRAVRVKPSRCIKASFYIPEAPLDVSERYRIDLFTGRASSQTLPLDMKGCICHFVADTPFHI